MPIGGKLVLKGGATLGGGGGGGVEKKKKKKKDKQAASAAAAAAAAAAACAEDADEAAAGPGPSSSGAPHKKEEALPKDKLPTAYEKAFEIEARRLQQGRERTGAWGATYRPPPRDAILHGRSAPIRGDTAEERLDLRSAAKADRYCK